MLHNNRYIYIACGGSGGHIMPGLGLCRDLAEIPDNIFVIGVKRQENIRIFNNYISNMSFKNVKYVYLQDLRLKKFTPLSVSVYVVRLLSIIFKVLIMFSDNRPSTVIGFGSYAAFPVVFVATFFKSTLTIIHEQNLKFGKANKLLMPLVGKIAISFTQSRKCLKEINKDLKFKVYNSVCRGFLKRPRIEEKIIFTGNPSIAKERKKYLERLVSLNDKKDISILVMGGSQGSSFINRIVPRALAGIKGSLSDRIKILHITGSHNVKEAEGVYKRANLSYNLMDVNFDMSDIYKRSDLVISRAGATTLSEIAFYKIPAILLPFRFSYAHQCNNVALFKDLEAAFVLDENNCSKDKLRDYIQRLLEDASLRSKFISNLGKIDSNVQADIFKRNLL